MKENAIYTAIAGFIGVAAIIYIVKQRRGTLNKREVSSKADSKISKTPSSASASILTLDKITIKTPQRQFILKDRQKFLDDWAAGEGGVQAIRDMYKKRPSAFPKADVVYLQSKGILPSENLVGRGLTTV